MFDFIFGSSYIDHSSGRIYLSDSYYSLQQKMNDSSSTITVNVMDFMGFTEKRTFNKSDIRDYGPN